MTASRVSPPLGSAMALRLAATLASALAYGLAFPGTAWSWLAWVALVPLLHSVRGLATRPALLLGFVWGTAMACVVAGWMPGAIVRYWQQPWLAGLAVLLGGTIVTASIFYMLFTAWYAAVAREVRAATPLFAACAWVAVELGRTELLLGNPWALVGYSQTSSPLLLQVADLAGVYAVGFPIVAVNAAVAELLVALGERDRATRAGALPRALRGALGAVAACVLVLGYGAWRLATPLPSGDGATRGEVVVVQGNLDLGAQWREEMFGANLDAYSALTRQALARTPADVVVWPENAMSFFVEGEPAFRGAIASLLEPHDAELLAGGPRLVRDADGGEGYRNAAFLIDPRGAIAGAYEKERLVPFAEAFPLLGADGLRERFGRVREFSPGGVLPPLPTRLGPAGVLICNEAFFPGLAAARVDAGAAWLVTLTNDSWVGAPLYAAMARDMALLRAVEQRRFLVRASTAGPSAVIDPYGRALAEAPFPSSASVAASVVATATVTPYARLGDAFAFACGLLAIGCYASTAWRGLSQDPRRSFAARPSRSSTSSASPR